MKVLIVLADPQKFDPEIELLDQIKGPSMEVAEARLVIAIDPASGSAAMVKDNLGGTEVQVSRPSATQA